MRTCSSIERKYSLYINTQIVFDATFNILDVVAKWPAGSTHDPRIFMGSGLRQLFERHRVPGTWVSCWVTAAILARRLDPLSQSTTGSTVKVEHSTQKYTKCCGERNRADETSISCPARRNTPQPREGNYSDLSPQPKRPMAEIHFLLPPLISCVLDGQARRQSRPGGLEEAPPEDRSSDGGTAAVFKQLLHDGGVGQGGDVAQRGVVLHPLVECHETVEALSLDGVGAPHHRRLRYRLVLHQGRLHLRRAQQVT
ncbi:hypothetical protein N1851_005070 [Merluccius polli]|uniref:Uncharacterized protein n=1 Tax=Merluccius polli TaxID=89951 RepID=A0AA47N804_MERPO|nr:hypothetical protein N1851_005070 [Merluccius polli]